MNFDAYIPHRFFRNTAWRLAAACMTGVFAQATSGTAHASFLSLVDRQAGQGFAFFAVFIAIVVFVWAFIAVRKLSRNEAALRRKLAAVELALNEAEATLAAEPGLLFIWRGRSDSTPRLVGSMCGTVDIPEELPGVLDFASWLEVESANALSEALSALRQSGVSFNIGIKTRKGELLEADGRAAGAAATLRLRSIIGERRHNTELSHEVRKLGKQVQRLSGILDCAPYPVWLNNKDGALIWVNSAYLDAVENSDIDYVLKKPVHLVNMETLEKEDGKQGPGNTGYCGRTSLVIRGAKHTLDVYSMATGNENAFFAIDMSEAANIRKELDLHISAHTSTLDNLATAVAIFGPDQRLRFYNSAYQAIWGLDEKWLDTPPEDGEILDRLRDMRKLPEQANYRSWKKEVLGAYRTLDTQENWWHLPDGTSLRVVAEQHPFGGVTYMYENVTEQINLASRYNALIKEQGETLDNLDEAVALFGTDGKLKLYNASYLRLWNFDSQDLEHHPHVTRVIGHCRKLFSDDGVWDDLKYCVTSLSGSRRAIHDRITRNDGKVLDAAAVPLPDGNTLVTYLDVSAGAEVERALRERNEALEAADRLKTNFLSNISYELRTPLNNITGFAESMSLGIAGPLQPKQEEYLGHIEESSNDLLAIIDAILDLTTIDAGAMELDLERVDIGDLLEAAAHRQEKRIEELDLTLNIEIGHTADYLMADRKRLDQIVDNILSNAIGFSPPHSTVRLGAKLDGKDMVIWVADSGRGMNPEFQKKAFERFQTVPISGGHRGPGLGLALVKSFVELHEGNVSLLSKPGHGTTVICRLPVKGPKAFRNPEEEFKGDDAGDDSGTENAG